jgi:pimeloyl-ACP methyl ester carboxylesterase
LSAASRVVRLAPLSGTLRLFAERWGERGVALVLGHGFGGSARNFRPQARVFANRARVILFDARGHARSDAPPLAESYAPGHFIVDLAAVLDAAGVERAVVGGLSMGAGIALRFALEHPERVSGLLLAAFPRTARDPGHVDWALGFADAIERDGLDAAGRDHVWGAVSRYDEKGAELIRRGFLEHSPQALAHVLRRLIAVQPAPEDLAAELGSLTCPALVIAGENDPGSLPHARALSRLLPRARLVEVPLGGHVVNLTSPDEFNAALRDFLVQFG